MKLTPVFNKILVRKVEELYEGRIHIPDTALKNPPVEGEIVAWGEDCVLPLKGEMKIVFGKYSAHDIPDGDHKVVVAGTPVTIKGNLAIIHEGDIWYLKENE